MRTRTKGIQLFGSERVVNKQYLGQGSFSVSARSRKTMQKPGFGVVSSKSTTSGQSNFEQALDRLWADGAARYLMECRQRGVRSLETIGYHVKILLPYIGSLHMDDVCNDSLETFKAQRVDEDGAKNSTVNRSLEVVRTVDEPRGARVA